MFTEKLHVRDTRHRILHKYPDVQFKKPEGQAW